MLVTNNLNVNSQLNDISRTEISFVFSVAYYNQLDTARTRHIFEMIQNKIVV